MTQGVVSMSARQVAPRKNTSKTFLVASATASMFPMHQDVQASYPDGYLVEKADAAPVAHAAPAPAGQYVMDGAAQAVDHFAELGRRDRQKVSRVRSFLSGMRSREEREKLRTVIFLNNRLPAILQKFNSQLEMLVTGDLFQKKFQVDKKRATKIHSALGEARANIVKQEHPLLTKMTTFNWVGHVELWDKELKDIQKRLEIPSTTVASPYAFGQPNLFNTLVSPVSVKDDAWKRVVSNFNTTLDLYAKKNVETHDRLLATLGDVEQKKKKSTVVSESRFAKLCNKVFRDFRNGRLRKRHFMKWINNQLANKAKAAAEVDQLVASMAILNSTIKSLDPNNVHVINAMTKAQVNEVVAKDVLLKIAKELESCLRLESTTLQGLTHHSLSTAISHGDNRYSRFLSAMQTAFSSEVTKKFENTLEYALLQTPKAFFEDMSKNKFVQDQLQSRMDAEDDKKVPAPVDPEIASSMFYGIALHQHALLQQNKANEADNASTAESTTVSADQ